MNSEPGRELDKLAMRKAMGVFATGVVVITTACDGTSFGMTANSLTSVSLEPPLLLACFAQNSGTAEAAAKRQAFVVNFLSERQQDISARFAGGHARADLFEGLEPEYADGDLPVIPRSLGWTLCRFDSSHVAGDHTVIFGRVISAFHREGMPLVFYRGAYHELSAEGVDANWFW